MHKRNNTQWIKGYWKNKVRPQGGLSCLLKPFILGIAIFSAMISLLMSFFGESGDNDNEGNNQKKPDGSYVP